MSIWRRRALITLALAGVASFAVAAVACGDSGNSYSGSSSPTAKAATTPASGGASATSSSSLGGAYTTPAAGGGASSAAGLGVGSTSLGQVLVDGAKMTLYTFDKDTANSGKSACSGQCATNWPPLVVTSAPPAPAGATGAVATVTRDDGTMQVTYNGMPLYRFAADKAPGDTKGDGVGGIWHVAKP